MVGKVSFAKIAKYFYRAIKLLFRAQNSLIEPLIPDNCVFEKRKI